MGHIYSILWLTCTLCLVNCDLNLPEGAPCKTGYTNGTCVNLYRCKSAAISYLFTISGLGRNAQRLPELCSVRKDGEPIVCCDDCKLDETEKLKSRGVLAGGVLYPREGPKAWSKCLEYFQRLPYWCRGTSIYHVFKEWDNTAKCSEWRFGLLQPGQGGVDAREGQFPHMALLGYGRNQASAEWLCGGSVISERFILTAGHCISTPTLGPIKYAGLGILKRTDLADLSKVYKIMEVIKYPDYKSPSKYHDIALLKTEYEINFSRLLLPACLDVAKAWTSSTKGEAPGWGKLGYKKPLALLASCKLTAENSADWYQDVKQSCGTMTLNQYSKEYCDAIYPKHRHLRAGYNETTQMCYGRLDKVVDTCEGDSGGPLQSHLDQCVYFVFGVTSYGKNCGIPGNAGMYTRVSHYLPWIESIVWQDEVF